MSHLDKEFSETKVIQAEAVSWLCRRDDGFSLGEQAEFDRWLSADSRHRAAVRQVEKACLILRKMPLAKETEASRKSIVFFRVAAAVAAILCLSFSLSRFLPREGFFSRTVSTAAAGLDSVSLPDGSSIALNSATELIVRFTAAKRQVTLLRGEAEFHVAKNKARPFIVAAGSVFVRAVGTSFDVRWSSQSIEVLVSEGKVQVSREPAVQKSTYSSSPVSPLRVAPAARPPLSPPILIAAGEHATILLFGSVAPEIKSISSSMISERLSWREPRLTFANTPLSLVAEEFNRYNSVRLVLADPELAHLPLVGSFRPDNLDAFIRLLEDGQKVIVERHPGVIILHKLH